MELQFMEGVELGPDQRGEALAVATETLMQIGFAAQRLLDVETGGEAPRLSAHFGEARANLVLAASALLASIDTKCTLATPPEDIRARPGKDGNLVLSCLHPTPHCWDGSGKLIPCS